MVVSGESNLANFQKVSLKASFPYCCNNSSKAAFSSLAFASSLALSSSVKGEGRTEREMANQNEFSKHDYTDFRLNLLGIPDFFGSTS